MDAEFWIYIAIGVIYFVSRMFKKPEQPAPQPRPGKPGQPSTATEQPAPVTFEDLLREITQARQAEPEPVAEYESYDSYEQDQEVEAQSLEEEGMGNEQRWKAYEEVPLAPVERKSLEETLRLEDTVVDFSRFDAFRKLEVTKMSDEYRKIIRDPQTLKQAVVMSEILQRKF